MNKHKIYFNSPEVFDVPYPSKHDEEHTMSNVSNVAENMTVIGQACLPTKRI